MLNEAQLEFVCVVLKREMDFYKIGSKEKRKFLINRLKTTTLTSGIVTNVCHQCLGSGLHKTSK